MINERPAPKGSVFRPAQLDKFLAGLSLIIKRESGKLDFP